MSMSVLNESEVTNTDTRGVGEIINSMFQPAAKSSTTTTSDSQPSIVTESQSSISSSSSLIAANDVAVAPTTTGVGQAIQNLLTPLQSGSNAVKQSRWLFTSIGVVIRGLIMLQMGYNAL